MGEEDNLNPYPMNPFERAKQIRQEAEVVMDIIGLPEILQPYGPFTLTGSYFLDVMVYPDIDLYIPPVTIEQLFHIGGQLAKGERVIEVVFQKSKLSALPGGLYLKPRIEYGDWGRPWKVDIWSVDEAIISRNTARLQHFKEKMTDELRILIIEYKYAILTKKHRTPMFSGFFIYQAFIDEGMRDFEAVTEYLIGNGIRMG